MRRRRQSQNLDSLLDTMANVVGILVVLVAVTQVSVGEALDRIRARGSARAVGEAELARAEAERRALDEALEDAEGAWRLATEASDPDNWLTEDLEDLLERYDALPDRDAPDELTAEALLERARLARSELAEKSEARAEAERRVAQLDDLISDVPTERRPKIARLPDPKPPPPGSREVAFLCREGRLIEVDPERMFAELRVMVQEAVGPGASHRAVRWEERDWLINLWKKQYAGARDVGWALVEGENGMFHANVDWRDVTAGEGRYALGRAASRYSATLARYRPDDHYLRFYVWADCFDTYLEARYLGEAKGFKVSWMPLEVDDVLGFEMTGRGPRPRRILVD